MAASALLLVLATWPLPTPLLLLLSFGSLQQLLLLHAAVILPTLLLDAVHSL